MIVDSYDALHLEKLASIKEFTAQHGYGMRVSFINEDYPSSSLRTLIPEVLENAPAGVILITSKAAQHAKQAAKEAKKAAREAKKKKK